MRKQQGMTAWYDPAQLTKTGIRVAISTVFGQFADKREALAAANAIAGDKLDDVFDYSERAEDGEFWIDFVADTGDGWRPTFAVARTLAEDALQPPGSAEPLKRGRVLVMGGDQVYPTASDEEYDNRLLYPFDEAYHPEGGVPKWPEDRRPDLYAIPGNHDWYDGLNSFFHLFCRRTVKPKDTTGVDRPGRVIGGRHTWQTRSYFALKLPGDWWLWGTDSQLKGYIDQPQIDYFQYVAQHWMGANSKLILCVGAPEWEYVTGKGEEKGFATFSYLERLAGAVDGKKIRLALVLSGDSHHYARYFETSKERAGSEGRESRIEYITSGGGGAFLHPTHHLKDEQRFKTDYPPPGVPYDRAASPSDRSFLLATKAGGREKALYPSRAVSRGLTFGNFLFPFLNWKMPTLVFFPAYLLFMWLLDFNARFDGHESLAAALGDSAFRDAVAAYWRLVFVSPWPVVLLAMALGGYYYFADLKNGALRFLWGAVHAAQHALAVTSVTCVVIGLTAHWWDDGFWGIAGSLMAGSFASALASGFVFGLYLWFSLLFLHIHWNEGYSSMGLTGYKGFLRMRIDTNGRLTVYPIGLKTPASEPTLVEPAITIQG